MLQKIRSEGKMPGLGSTDLPGRGRLIKCFLFAVTGCTGGRHWKKFGFFGGKHRQLCCVFLVTSIVKLVVLLDPHKSESHSQGSMTQLIQAASLMDMGFAWVEGR